MDGKYEMTALRIGSKWRDRFTDEIVTFTGISIMALTDERMVSYELKSKVFGRVCSWDDFMKYFEEIKSEEIKPEEKK